MPWYRIYANHGPGHQSSTEFYRYHAEALDTKERRKNVWEDIFDNGHYDWPIGDVELCDKLPQHIHDDKVETYQSNIHHAQRMLEILTKTKTMPVIAVRYEIKPAAKPGEKPVTGHQARLLAHPTIVGPMKDSRDKAVNALLAVLRKDGSKVSKKDYAVICR